MKNSNVVLLILATLIVAAGVYWYFFTGTGNDAPLTPTTAENAAQSQFQVLVSELQPITFNTGIFSNPQFLSLVDLTTPVAPEMSGRLDPFGSVH